MGPEGSGRPGHVWVDGRLQPADAPHLSAFDRGFQLGDGVFETLRVRGGVPTELAEHTSRLRRSAEGLAIPLPPAVEATIARGIAELVEAEGLDGPEGDASIRITVSRGRILARGLLPPEPDIAPTIVIQAWPVVPAPPGHVERGLHLAVSAIRRDPENPLASLKTTSRADYVVARLVARREGADDALFLTTDGFLSEATTAARHDAIVAPRLGGAGRTGATGGLVDGRRSRGCPRGLPVEQRGRCPARHATGWRADRIGCARSLDDPRTDRPGGLHPR
ncbi:MAG: hypothetical protein E6I94_09940 [Chloroflexi bacterium]|nr:MAG: hypothetical protein E6I94_09940 [Chloroflexota bacterium]